MGNVKETPWKEKLEKIKLLLLDVDGVLTDGRIIMDDDGREIKHFDVRDGHGIKILQRFDIDVVFLTGRKSSVVEHRARDLGVQEVHQQIWDKVAAFEGIIQRRGLTADQVAFMGDDIVDIPLQRRVGFSAAPADAEEVVRRSVDYVTGRPGGRGAVREVCELILRGRGVWDEVARRYEFTQLLDT
ncbi:MAG: phenylphosphate carboxylase subunit delta [Deltaproteobacteria bacterium HGW-Deltaproteobacteria-19]|jgi:3-deoxy-D-manno-octulosonate 8-phosphate phosphatase (KDO 8-P phosphatase)|nr:MAG: phenylphosphate carboxylase subunit delta [Deltaproteobacteria bacterium HGW-Deltaproteobacteria-19]